MLKQQNKQEVEFKTEDGFNLKADYYSAQGERAVILLHQFRQDRASMTFLAERLNLVGYSVLSIDLRGHGQSDGDWERFSNQDFNNMFNDARAADDYLHELNPNVQVQMIGASIGANTALRYQEMNTLNSVILLSPGLDYHGIKTEDSNLSNIACPIFYITSEKDQAVNETKELFEKSPLKNEKNKLMIYPGDKHGIFILEENPQAVNNVVEWLKLH